MWEMLEDTVGRINTTTRTASSVGGVLDKLHAIVEEEEVRAKTITEKIAQEAFAKAAAAASDAGLPVASPRTPAAGSSGSAIFARASVYVPRKAGAEQGTGISPFS